MCLLNTTVPKGSQVSYNEYSKTLRISKTNAGSYHFVGVFFNNILKIDRQTQGFKSVSIQKSLIVE